MSAIVTQLSYNINEKLRLDDHAFPAFQPHHKADPKVTPTTKSTSFSPKEPCGQWAESATAGSTSFITSTAASTSLISSESRLYSNSGAVVGVACPRLTQRSASLQRRDIRPVALVRTSTRDAESSLTTVFDLRECSQQKYTRKSFSAEKQHSPKMRSMPVTVEEPTEQASGNHAVDTFPSIVGRSCVLHPCKKNQSTTGASAESAFSFGGVPPNKKHCRSVSEPDDLVDVSSWNPGQSRLWVPVRRLRSNARRAYSASSSSGRLGDCSRSLDCASLNSGSSLTGDSLLTPPASPVPRPASVTVIKQEGGAWTFLSSQHSGIPGIFSPLSSPSSNISSSARPHDPSSSRLCCSSGLAATKRSLSFSDDFEHRESIQYTPTSTPELERRFDQGLLRRGGLLRCQSHPSDLNLRKGKSRRRTSNRLSHRPTVDFAKMKQTSINKRNRCRDRGLSNARGSTSACGWTSLQSNNQVPAVKPVFPSIISSESPLKKHALHKLQPVPSLSPPSVSFTIGSSKPLSDIQRRIPSPTDEVPTDPEDDVLPECDVTATTSGGPAASFVRECSDLNVEEIENETDEEMVS